MYNRNKKNAIEDEVSNDEDEPEDEGQAPLNNDADDEE